MKKIELIRTICDGHFTYGYLRMPDGETFDTIELNDKKHSSLLKPLMNLPEGSYSLKVVQSPQTLQFYFSVCVGGAYRHACIYPIRLYDLRGGMISVKKEDWKNEDIEDYFHDLIEETFMQEGKTDFKKGFFKLEIGYSPTFVTTEKDNQKEEE